MKRSYDYRRRRQLPRWWDDAVLVALVAGALSALLGGVLWLTTATGNATHSFGARFAVYAVAWTILVVVVDVLTQRRCRR